MSEPPFPATPAHTLHGSPVPRQVQTLTPAFWLVRPGPGNGLVMSALSTPPPLRFSIKLAWVQIHSSELDDLGKFISLVRAQVPYL